MKTKLVSMALLTTMSCGVNAPKEVQDRKTALINTVTQTLECEEYARPSTLHRLRSVIENPNADTAKSLFLHPEQVADVVALLGPEIESLVVLGRNVRKMADEGHFQQIATNGFSSLTCGDQFNVACTAGSAVSTVQCTRGNQDAVEMAYQRCMWNGTLHEGSIHIQPRNPMYSLGFSNFTLNEINQINGKAGLAWKDNTLSLNVTEAPMSIVSHGGPQSAVGCGSSLTLSQFQLQASEEQTTLAFEGSRENEDDRLNIKATQLTFEPSCACPQPGSAITMDIARPAEQADQLGEAEIKWSAPANANSCASATVYLSKWPSQCPGQADCGKATTEKTLSELLTALCVPIPQ